MADTYFTLTLAVDSDALLRWTGHQDRGVLSSEAVALLETGSTRDWLMSEISEASHFLGLTSLDWLATNSEAPSRTTEHLDSSGNWWFVWVLYRDDICDAVQGLGQLLRYAREHLGKFGATDADWREAAERVGKCEGKRFDPPNPNHDGDDPVYVLSVIQALWRLLDLAHTQGIPVVHMRYSYRAGP